MIALCLALPAFAHLTGAPVRWLLPMHWPVIAAGLIVGWRGGLTVGLLAPASNYLLTGYPLPMVLQAMTVELALYGFLSGWLTNARPLNPYLALTISLSAGRIGFIATVLLFGTGFGAIADYLMRAMLPGLTAGVIQILFFGIIASRLTNKGR